VLDNHCNFQILQLRLISFDEKFELVEVLEGRVYQQPRGYFLDYTIITKDFNDDEIFWS
jgi:hypothetical protein